MSALIMLLGLYRALIRCRPVRRLAGAVLSGCAVFISTNYAHADLLADWGVFPQQQDVTFSFAPSDASTNFTDQYTFTLVGGTDIAWTTSSFLGTCTKGCGSPSIQFGIYDATGGLISNTGGINLGPGNYIFQIKGTGMGAGNTAGSGGVITFSGMPQIMEIVSPAPEPSGVLLLSAGLLVMGVVCHREKMKSVSHNFLRRFSW